MTEYNLEYKGREVDVPHSLGVLNDRIDAEKTERENADAELRQKIEEQTYAVYRVKGTVATVSALPEDAEIGDVYNIQSNGDNYVYTSEGWDKLSGTIDLTPYVTNSSLTSRLASYLTTSNASNTYQQKLTAGENITISGNTISASGGGGSYTVKMSSPKSQGCVSVSGSTFTCLKDFLLLIVFPLPDSDCKCIQSKVWMEKEFKAGVVYKTMDMYRLEAGFVKNGVKYENVRVNLTEMIDSTKLYITTSNIMFFGLNTTSNTEASMSIPSSVGTSISYKDNNLWISSASSGANMLNCGFQLRYKE